MYIINNVFYRTIYDPYFFFRYDLLTLYYNFLNNRSIDDIHPEEFILHVSNNIIFKYYIKYDCLIVNYN